MMSYRMVIFSPRSGGSLNYCCLVKFLVFLLLPVPNFALNITKEDIDKALVKAEELVNHRLVNFQTQIYEAGSFHEVSSPPWFMSVSHKANKYAENLTFVSLLSEEATQILAQQFHLNPEQIAYSLPNLDIRGTNLHTLCPVKADFPCQPRKYRAYNGYCNNVQHPRWGSANTRYLRYLTPMYADGVTSARLSTTADPLPSSRQVSISIHMDHVDRPHNHLMSLTAVWAELVAKDISYTPQFSGYRSSAIKCCAVAFQHFHPECYPIRVDTQDDPYYSNVNCQEYVRSSVAPRKGCTLGPREQINQVSSFLDGSLIYGSNKGRAEEIRLHHGGLLRTQVGPGGELLPPTESETCRQSPEKFKCFKAGDDRVNENTGLAALQTLWMREHNRLARELGTINPHWSDETLFQESRRIVLAELQHITYNEFIPVLLGQETVTKYELKLLASGFYDGYDMNTNGGVLNSVATAALWFFASLMPKSMPLYDSVGRKVGEKDIAQTLYAPFDLYRNGLLDQILRGLLKGKAQGEDQFINDVMTNRMFEDPSKPGLGLDMAAQIVQQGRDHGIPGYIYYRELCGLGKAKTFLDFNGTMSDEVILSLGRVYRAPEDVDLFTGGLAEYPMEGAVMGPTFGCLLGIQFQKIRKGDRYWYENDLPPSAFTLDQLQEIRKTSFARIICDNSNAVGEVQPNVFLEQDPFLNSPMHCEGVAIRPMDLAVWYNEPVQKPIPSSKLKHALAQAKADIAQLHSRERQLFNQHEIVDPLSPVGTASGFNKPKTQALEIANASFLLQFATERFLSEFIGSGSGNPIHSLQDNEDSPREVRNLLRSLQSVDLTDALELPKSQRCGEHDLPCDHTNIFRSITGWCNNLQDAGRGKAFRPFARMAPPSYHDGIKEPRILGKKGTLLPSARLVSTEIHDDISVPHVRYTLLVAQFGQLLDHDLTHTPMNRGFRNSILDCHSCESPRRIHRECWPISIPPHDPYFPQFNSSTGEPFCLPFTRSLPGQLTLGYREQVNQVTAYVDASFVYGSDICEAKKLRSFVGGRLNTTSHPGEYKELLPQTRNHPECKSPSGLCFEAGDLRASEQPVLAVIHTFWLREHNRLAAELQNRNSHWDDELLYQHSRRILSAVTQHITYQEFLPRIMGWDAIHKFDLELESEGYFEGYDETCDPIIFNEFATAAFRFGHSLLKPSFKRVDPNNPSNEKKPSIQLRHTFFSPNFLFQSGIMDELMLGLVNTPMETLDSFITEEVTNHLFEDRKRGPVSGMDLAALNIQRGRDHGIPGYNEYRDLCNLTKARNFEDLRKEIPPRLIQKLKGLYETVEDIDLFPGGLAEIPLKGGVVGPTFACIIGKQFSLLRKCDRFWYENGNPLTRFTKPQLMEIRKASLAKLICDNGDEVKLIQRSVLDVSEPFLNPRMKCNSLPSIDLDLWKQQVDYCQVKGQKITMGKSTRVSPCVMCTCTKEGPLCQSMKINNCIRLSRSYPANDILNDYVCKVQCAFAFRAFQSAFTREVESDGDEIPAREKE